MNISSKIYFFDQNPLLKRAASIKTSIIEIKPPAKNTPTQPRNVSGSINL